MENNNNLVLGVSQIKIWDNLLLSCLHKVSLDYEAVILLSIKPYGLFILCLDIYDSSIP
jgi:hypothetical protein